MKKKDKKRKLIQKKINNDNNSTFIYYNRNGHYYSFIIFNSKDDNSSTKPAAPKELPMSQLVCKYLIKDNSFGNFENSFFEVIAALTVEIIEIKINESISLNMLSI